MSNVPGQAQVVGLAALGVLVSALLIAWWNPDPVGIVLLVIAMLIAFAIIFALMDRQRNIFDPVYVSSFAFALLFLSRPVYDYMNDTFVWVNINVDTSILDTLWGVAVAVFFFYLGSFLPIGRAVSGVLPPPPNKLAPNMSLIIASSFLGIAVMARIVAAMLAGGLSTLMLRREHFPPGGRSVPFITEAMQVSVPAFLLFSYVYARYPRKRLWASIGAFACLLIVLQTVWAGDRRWMLSFAAAAVTFYFLSRRTNPNILALAFLGFIMFVGLVGPVELSRGGQVSYAEGIIQTVVDPFAVAESLLLQSQSTSQVNAFALVVDDMDFGSIPYRYGISTATETLLQPIPREIWTGKPEPIRTVMISSRWGWEGTGCAGLCPTFSALATFYSDLGLVGIAFGAGVAGMLLRTVSSYHRLYRDSFVAQAYVSVLVMVPFFLWWGALSNLTLALLTGVIPIFIAATIAGTGYAQRVPQRRRERVRSTNLIDKPLASGRCLTS